MALLSGPTVRPAPGPPSKPPVAPSGVPLDVAKFDRAARLATALAALVVDPLARPLALELVAVLGSLPGPVADVVDLARARRERDAPG